MSSQCISLKPHVSRLLTVGLCTLCMACGSFAAQQPPPQPTTATASATTVVALGQIAPDGEVIKLSVPNAADSRVNQILVKEGDRVQANQVIAILQGADRRQANLRAAQANVQLLRAQLEKARQGDTKPAQFAAQQAAIARLEAQLRTETAQRQAAIASAQAAQQEAALVYQRRQTYGLDGAISRDNLDEAQRNLDTTQAELNQRQAELQQTIATLQAQLVEERAKLSELEQVLPVDVEIATAELQRALIEVEQRRADLDDVQVRVPIAGQILKINTRIGEQVNTSAGIVELAKTDQMFAVAEVYETDITKIRLGQRATITSEYGGLQGEVHGNVDQIGLQIGRTELNQDQTAPTTDINARVVSVKIRLDRADSPKVEALTGMQVRVKIDVASGEN